MTTKKSAPQRTARRRATKQPRTNLSLDSLLTLEATHSLNVAVAAGDFRVSVLAEVERLLNERPGNQLKTAREGTRRLQENRLINAQEAKEINEICKTIFAAQRGKGDPEAAARRVRQTYERMLDKAASSPVALAIAGLASSGPIETPAGDGASPNVVAAPAISRSNRISLGMVGGVIGGAVIGGAIGGGGGAIIGAVVGGIAGGIAAACT